MKRFSVFCAGFLMGAILFGAAFAFAAVGEKSVKIKFNNMKVVVNGKLVPASEEPFTMGGKTYVPLRMIGEALGQNVGYENGTVLVGVNEQSLLLSDLLKPSETGVKTSAGIGTGITVAGKAYTKGFYIEGSKARPTGSLKFTVQGSGMKKITGSLALDDSNPESIEPVQVEILKDNSVIWEGELARGESPVSINIPIDSSTNNVYFNFKNMNNTKVDFINVIGQY